MRKPKYPINPLILNRWSPRAMSSESLTDQELMTLFEAARWAPSSFNNQPWRFIYAKRDTKAWDTVFNLLIDFNKSWAHAAAVLIVVICRDSFALNGKVSITAQFDTGSSWENLALQASTMGLVAHGMEGFDYVKAKKECGVPDGYSVLAMIAVGKPGSIALLPEELQAREEPSDRVPVNLFIHEGSFKTEVENERNKIIKNS